MSKYILSIVACLISVWAFAQSDDPVLFSVEGKPVHVSEFDYIYSKNTGKNTDYSLQSLEEYLELYVKFKLKVERAKELQLDTIPDLKKELEGYRKQLAKSYLTDKEVTDRLVREVYDRSKRDIRLAHILVSLKENAGSEAVSTAKTKIDDIYNKLQNGLSFDDAVQQLSEDELSKENGGSLPFLNAMFPAGFYDLENVGYALKKGEISKPVRSKLGYHIVRLEESREARGEVEIAHILIRKEKIRQKKSDGAERIQAIYERLQAGEEFGPIANQLSEDNSSARNDGYLGYFGINKYEKSFEDAAFSLTKDGTYTMPIKTSVGWHIIKRISKKEQPSFEDAQKRLKSLVIKDPRHNIAKETLIERIKTESNFIENKEALSKYAKSLDKDFFSYKWRPEKIPNNTLFSFGDSQVDINDFIDYAKSNTRARLRMDEMSIDDAINSLYTKYVEEKAIDYEEKQLINKYPDFKAIMREYEEGILLFEVTKMNVWDKASQDSVGLEKFYESHINSYQWKERAKTQTYTLNTKDEAVVAKFMKKARKKSPEWLKNKFGDIFTIEEQLYERGSKEVSGIKFSPKSLSLPVVNEKKSTTTFRKIVEIIPSSTKSLAEARGYIEADYQDQLERNWVNSLKQKYNVEINQTVLKSLVK